MTDLQKKIVGSLALAAALVAAVLPVFGVRPDLVAEATKAFAAIAATVSLYFHASPDLPLPDAWQERLGKIAILLGGAAFFVAPVVARLGLTSRHAAQIIQAVGAVKSVLGAYAVRSPQEKKLWSTGGPHP